AASVGLDEVDLHFAGLVGGVGDPAAVGAPGDGSLLRFAGAGEVAGRAVLGGEGPDVAARDGRDALAAGRDRPVGDLRVDLARLRAEGGTVARDEDVDGGVAAVGAVEAVELRAALEDDLAAPVRAGAHRGPLHVVVGEGGALLALAGARVVRPEVQSVLGARVGEVEDRVARPHGDGVGAFPVGHLLGFVGLQVEKPDVGRHAAAVALPGAEVARVGRVGEPLAVGADRSLRTVGHGEFLVLAAVGLDGEELGLAC